MSSRSKNEGKKPDVAPAMIVFCLDEVVEVFQDSFAGCGYAYGENGTEGWIKLCQWTSDEEKDRTILHELIHRIDDLMKIGLNEAQVSKLENGLFQVLKQNNWIRPMYGQKRREKESK